MSATRFAFALAVAIAAFPTAGLAQSSSIVVEGTITFGGPAPAPAPPPIVAPAAPPPAVIVAPAAAPPPVLSIAPAAPPPGSVAAQASVETEAPRTTRRWGLVGAGAGLALGAYALNLVGTLLWMAVPTGVASTDFLVPTWNGHREELLLWSLVPVAGPLVQIGYAEEEWQIPLFAVASALEIAGFVMAIVGTVSRVPAAPREARAPSPGVSVVPYASGTGGGLTVAGSF